MLMEGTIQGDALAGVFEALAQESRTGILTVQGGDEIIAVSLSAGRVVSADALNRSVDDGLGEILIERKLVDAGEFSVLVSEQQAGGGRVVDLLVERSFLDRDQLLEVLRDYHYRLLLDPFRWDEGEFRFYEGEEVAFEEGIESISVPELLVRVSYDLPDRAPVGFLPSLEDRYELAPRQPDAAPATANENLLIAQLSEPRTVAELAAASDVDPHEAVYYVRRLTEDGYLVRSSVAPEESSVPVGLAPEPAVEDPETPFGGDLLSASPEPAAPAPASVMSGPAAGASVLVDDFVQEAEVVPVPAEDQPAARRPRERKAKKRRQEPSVWLERWAAVAGQVLAGLFTAVIVAQALSGTGALELGLPALWQVEETATTRARRAALYEKIDRGLRTHFLNESEFPPDLRTLVEQRLLGPGELDDPMSRDVAYSPMAAAYLLEDRAAPGESSAATVGIAGDLLLDPSSFAAEDSAVTAARQPLILLD